MKEEYIFFSLLNFQRVTLILLIWRKRETVGSECYIEFQTNSIAGLRYNTLVPFTQN